MPTTVRPSPPLADCALEHHHIGRHVQWSAWDKELQRNVIRRGVVVHHRPDLRFMAIQATDGREYRTSCGPVAPWIES